MFIWYIKYMIINVFISIMLKNVLNLKKLLIGVCFDVIYFVIKYIVCVINFKIVIVIFIFVYL